jgi:hypothetical protein
MLGPDELQRWTEIDRQAKALADRGGTRPKLEPLTIGIAAAVAVFSLLDIFAAVTLPDRDAAFWPVVIITIICSGGSAAVQWWRERAWQRRHTQALRDVEAIGRSSKSA